MAMNAASTPLLLDFQIHGERSAGQMTGLWGLPATSHGLPVLLPPLHQAASPGLGLDLEAEMELQLPQTELKSKMRLNGGKASFWIGAKTVIRSISSYILEQGCSRHSIFKTSLQ